ncbi:ribonuclease T2 [Vigna unguiculata]|uniref:Ribonuclease T2 n=1 Tax=Vigna unguiculata TaxID=3917 RepID=A0A4D6LXA7_VIGUN|nr:ribonuclease T2 [Vigna unguiculata]
MTNFLFVLIVFFLFYDCSKAFDHWTVAETWPAGFCSAIPCNAGKAKLRKFTIHGLWPSNYTNPQPRTCSSQVLQISEIAAIESELKQDWPDYFGNDLKFWSRQWIDHGSCSNMKPFDFFNLALDIYRRNNLTAILENAGISPGGEYPINDFISAISTSIGVKPQINKAFDHWTVAETWPAGFCSAIPCNAGKAKLRKFTIHGLWPSNYTNPQPRTCSSQVLQISEIAAIESELKQDWPDYFGNDLKFWSRQWIDHGSCSNMKPFDFFNLALDIYRRNNLTAILENAGISPGGEYPINDFISAISTSIGVKPQIKCSRQYPNHLVEIRLCLNTKNIPQFINCATGSGCKPELLFLQ